MPVLVIAPGAATTEPGPQLDTLDLADSAGTPVLGLRTDWALGRRALGAQHLGDADLILVAGTPADTGHVLARLLTYERLATPVGTTSTPVAALTASEVHRWQAGAVTERPLIRDDAAGITVATTVIRPAAPASAPEGEAYADENLLFRGPFAELELRTSDSLPGIISRARVPRRAFLRTRLTPTPEYSSRAVQVGGHGLLVVRDGVAHRRPLKHWTAYRHTEPWRRLDLPTA